MTLTVLLTSRALQELQDAAHWWAEHRSAAEAERWHMACMTRILSLEHQPERCSFARENGRMPYEVRQLPFGLGRRFTHRAVFTIRDNTVVVLAVRHLAQQDLIDIEDLAD